MDFLDELNCEPIDHQNPKKGSPIEMLQQLSELPKMHPNDKFLRQHNDLSARMEDSAISSSTHLSPDGKHENKGQRRHRLIKPKPNSNVDNKRLAEGEIKLIPKWQIIQPSKQSDPILTNESQRKRSDEYQGIQPCGTTVIKTPIQTMKPTSEPRKATLMTENGPVDVRIILSLLLLI